MRKLIQATVSVALFIGLSACGGFRAFPEPPFENTDQIASTKFAFQQAAYNTYYAASGTDKLNQRNKIINAQIRAYDIRFQEYEESLFELGIGLGVGTDWATLALGGLTATVGGTATKAAFGAVTAGITGAKGALDKHLFMEKTLPVIMTEIANQRAAILLQIRAGLAESDVNKYSLDQGLSDLQRYARAGSIVSALTGIAANSGSELKQKNQELNELITRSFQYDAASAKLLEFWRPGGVVNVANSNRLKAEMQKLGLITSGAGRIADLINHKNFAPMRLQIVKALGL